MVSFSVVIATCGRPERLAKCLDAVQVALRNWGGQGEIIVVDNHPEYAAEGVVRPVSGVRCQVSGRSGIPQTGDQRPEEGEGLRAAVLQSNVQGPVDKVSHLVYLRTEPFNKAKALNAGIAAARGEWLAFTDDDTVPDRQWLGAGARFAATGLCRVFGGRVEPGPLPNTAPVWLRPGRSGRFPWIGGALVCYDPMPNTGRISSRAPIPFGANIFVRRDVFAEHGGYDEALWKLCGRAALGVDDGEFGVRLQNVQEPIGYCREALMVHPAHEERFSRASHLQTAYRYGWRDPLVFFDPRRPFMETFRLRGIVTMMVRSFRATLAGDHAAALTDLSEVALHAGAIAGRLSSSYRQWSRLHAAGYRVPAC